tara:strand:- start:3489 stop:4400 length:912 start_codon:yes stop_codon:yes gene_type:complete
MENNCKYVSIRGIAQSCDVYPKNLISDTMLFNKEDYKNIKNNDTVFVISSVLNQFVINIYPILQKNNFKIKLITGACIQGVPNEVSNNHKINYYEIFFKKTDNIIAWFTQNYDNNMNLKNMYSIPLGLDYHTLQRGNHWWGCQNTAVEQETNLINIFNKAPEFNKRLNKSFSFFQFQLFERHNRDRYIAIENLNNKDFNVFLKERINRNKTWEVMTIYKFIISPHGNGLDCHRTYESMLLGCIPIVKSSSLDYLYKDLPILILKSWSELNTERLNNFINNFDIKNYNYDKLNLKYWITYIKNN